MLTLGIVLAACAVVAAGRWWLHRYDALGRSRRFPHFTVALLGLLAAASAMPTYLRHHEEDRLSAVASTLVGVGVRVHCQTLGGEFTDATGDLGHVRFSADGVPEHQTLIKRGPCTDLRHYLASDKSHPSAGEVVAVHVLTHESMHMRGQRSESMAECEAVQRDAETAQLLGATPAQAMLLARTYWIADYPLMPDAYRTSDCAPGGGLDEHLPNPPWSTGPVAR
jgi:hypothetical protein